MTADPLFEHVARALVGRYQLIRELGRGGMATVYLASDTKLGRQVAIKVLAPEIRAYFGSERFEREVRLAAQLSHPHIVPLFEADEADGLLYYVLEYVAGETLADRLTREGPLPLEDALRIAAEVGDALQHAHDHGVIHRDIKPPNILLGGGHARVSDFGVAKIADAENPGNVLTETGTAVGTLGYMSPEQAGGERRVDARSDVYGLGVLLYEMLVGEPPFTGPSVQAVMARILAGHVDPIRTVRPTVPAHVDEAVLAALEKLPADRPPSARAFVARLTRPRVPRWWRTPALVIGAAVVALGIFAVWFAGKGGARVPIADMALVGGGTFQLFGGQCPQCLPARTVQLDSFYIDRTEVTVDRYARYVSAGRAAAPWTVRPPDGHPVSGVMWSEAAGYCRWRDSLTRLPSEEEWEVAARGPDARLYPWGAAWEAGRANANNIRPEVAPAGAFPEGNSAAGVADLVGNVWEWTASAAPAAPPGGERFIIRGGAYDSPPAVATGVYRAAFPAAVPENLRGAMYDRTGFRCVRRLRLRD